MADLIEYEWSLQPDLGTVDKDDSVSYSISVERVETTNAIPPETEDTVERYDVDDLKFEQIIETEDDYLPDGITIDVGDILVSVSGIINTPVQFIDLAYSNQGVTYDVDTIDEIPKGSRAYKLVPDDSEYKYYYWRVYAIDDENNDELVERTFTLRVQLSFDDAKQTIKKIVSEIQ